MARTAVVIAQEISDCQKGKRNAKNEISILNCGSVTPKLVELLNSNHVPHNCDEAEPAK